MSRRLKRSLRHTRLKYIDTIKLRRAKEKGEKIPSSEYLKTVLVICDIFYNGHKERMTRDEIDNYITIPYSRVEAAMKKLQKLFPKHSEEVAGLYRKSIQVYYLTPEEAEYLYLLISDYVETDKVWDVFKAAVEIGVFCSESRIEAMEDAVGESLAGELIYETVVKGYLFRPDYTDPIAALESLKNHFDKETAAKLLSENPEYLVLFKDEFYDEAPEEREEREEKLKNIISKYPHN